MKLKYKLSGVQHYSNDFIELLDESYEYSLNKAEIREECYYPGRLYRYEVYEDDAVLVPEPDNPYDENAIAVLSQGIKIGYVPKGKCSEIRKLIDSGYAFRVEIVGGPYKYVYEDDDGKIQIEKGTLNYAATLTACQVSSGDVPVEPEAIVEPEAAVVPERHVSVMDPAPPKPSRGRSIFKFVFCIFSIFIIIAGLLVALVSPLPGIASIILGIFFFIYFKKK